MDFGGCFTMPCHLEILVPTFYYALHLEILVSTLKLLNITIIDGFWWLFYYALSSGNPRVYLETSKHYHY